MGQVTSCLERENAKREGNSLVSPRFEVSPNQFPMPTVAETSAAEETPGPSESSVVSATSTKDVADKTGCSSIASRRPSLPPQALETFLAPPGLDLSAPAEIPSAPSWEPTMLSTEPQAGLVSRAVCAPSSRGRILGTVPMGKSPVTPSTTPSTPIQVDERLTRESKFVATQANVVGKPVSLMDLFQLDGTKPRPDPSLETAANMANMANMAFSQQELWHGIECGKYGEYQESSLAWAHAAETLRWQKAYLQSWGPLMEQDWSAYPTAPLPPPTSAPRLPEGWDGMAMSPAEWLEVPPGLPPAVTAEMGEAPAADVSGSPRTVVLKLCGAHGALSTTIQEAK